LFFYIVRFFPYKSLIVIAAISSGGLYKKKAVLLKLPFEFEEEVVGVVISYYLRHRFAFLLPII